MSLQTKCMCSKLLLKKASEGRCAGNTERFSRVDNRVKSQDLAFRKQMSYFFFTSLFFFKALGSGALKIEHIISVRKLPVSAKLC